MDRQFRHAKTCRPQLCERQPAPFTHSQYGYHIWQTSAIDHGALRQQFCEQNCTEGLPTRIYSTSNLETYLLNSPTSSDAQSNITMPEIGFVGDCGGYCVNGVESPNFFGSTEFLLPSHNLVSESKDASLDQNFTFNSMVSLNAPDNFFGRWPGLEPVQPCQNMRAGPACFDSLNDIAISNHGSLMSANDSIIVENTEPWTVPPDGENGHTIDINFMSSVDNGATNGSMPNSNMPNSQNDFYTPILSPGMTMDCSSADLSGVHMDMRASGAASPLQNEPRWDLGHLRHEESPTPFYSTNNPLWNTKTQSQKPQSTILDYTLRDVELDLSERFPKPEESRKLPPLKPKSNPAVIGVITGSDNKTVTSKLPRKLACRDGPLDTEVRKGASKMRDIGACLTCKLRKTRCSGQRGEVCEHCIRKKVLGGLQPVPCLRGPLPKFEDAFCPFFAFGHLEAMATEHWIKESQVVPVGNEVLIKFSSGPFLSSMSFFACEIRQPNPDFLQVPDLSSDTHDRVQKFASVPSLPYALSDYDIVRVRSECLRYINTISKCPIHLLEKLNGETSAVVWRSLEAVWNFLSMSLAARQNGLLRNVITLYWTLYAMGRDINLTVESVAIAIENLRNPSLLLPSESEVSARVAARQIKSAMALIYKDLLPKVLEGLETAYKSDTRTSAAISFCVNLILCFIVGELQTVFDGLVIYNISEEGEDALRATERGAQCCKVVEEVLIFYSWTAFFDNGRRWNPIKDKLDDVLDQEHGVAALADDIHSIMRDLEEEITDQAAETGNISSKTTLDHKQFILRNQSKHVCQYLKKFY